MIHFRNNSAPPAPQDVHIQALSCCECLGWGSREKEGVNVLAIHSTIVWMSR